ISHDDILKALNQFTVKKATEGRIKKLTTDAIQALTTLFLQKNIFTYNGKIYRYAKGSPLNLSLTELLFNIYLYYWQVPLVREMHIANKFYGRYHNI
ncbi:unnamed protein product, partial [Adineta steineri]